MIYIYTYTHDIPFSQARCLALLSISVKTLTSLSLRSVLSSFSARSLCNESLLLTQLSTIAGVRVSRLDFRIIEPSLREDIACLKDNCTTWFWFPHLRRYMARHASFTSQVPCQAGVKHMHAEFAGTCGMNNPVRIVHARFYRCIERNDARRKSCCLRQRNSTATRTGKNKEYMYK